MKIAINCRLWLPGKLEGIGFFLQEVVRRWIEAHPKDEFHLLFDRPTGLDFKKYPQVTTHVLYPPARHPILYRIWFNLRVPLRLRRIRPDIFFSPEPMCPYPKSGKQLITVHDLAYLHYPHTFNARDLKYYRKWMTRFLRQADHIITVSQFTKTDILRHFPALKDQITIAHNGCRNIFTPLQTNEIEGFRSQHTDQKPYFFYYGSINARKNIHNLLLGFERFKEDTQLPHLLVIGGRKGWKTDKLERVYESHAFKTDIRFTGYLEESELVKWLGASTALTYVSYFEGFGLPVLEAMKSGVPVITSEKSSMQEIARDAAFYVNPHSSEEISEAMIKLAQNPNVRKEYTSKGLVRAQLFSWEDTAQRIWDVLELMYKSS
jgi:glycosyltransferase involved in cell wall biosynthesis